MKNTPIYKLIPNVITICGLCLGISAVRYGFDQKFTIAVALILMAAIMDSLDGKLARILQCSSVFGMQIDSLSDIVSFGVAPALLVYMWSLEDIIYKGVGWSVVLFYITCTALRLARFNATQSDETDISFFVGVPVPAAAVITMLPMMISFKIEGFYISPNIMAVYMFVISWLMISKIPTFSGKKMEINDNYISILLTLSPLIVFGIVFDPWTVIPLLACVYISSIPVSVVCYRRYKSDKHD